MTIYKRENRNKKEDRDFSMGIEDLTKAEAALKDVYNIDMGRLLSNSYASVDYNKGLIKFEGSRKDRQDETEMRQFKKTKKMLELVSQGGKMPPEEQEFWHEIADPGVDAKEYIVDFGAMGEETSNVQVEEKEAGDEDITEQDVASKKPTFSGAKAGAKVGRERTSSIYTPRFKR